MSYTLIGADGAPYASETPGTLGGHARTRVYGRLDCPVALSWIRRGSAMPHRVFFADEATAIAAGYRPCGACMRAEYATWKAAAAPRSSAQTSSASATPHYDPPSAPASCERAWRSSLR